MGKNLVNEHIKTVLCSKTKVTRSKKHTEGQDKNSAQNSENPPPNLDPGISLFAIYNYCPCATVIYNTTHKYIYSALRPFVHPRQVMLPEGLPEGNTNCRG